MTKQRAPKTPVWTRLTTEDRAHLQAVIQDVLDRNALYGCEAEIRARGDTGQRWYDVWVTWDTGALVIEEHYRYTLPKHTRTACRQPGSRRKTVS